ncbi:MAG: aconitate hydratase [Candidatus Izemoplasmatales bacterium]
MNLTYKILSSHLLEGELKKGNEIKIKIDQTLTQDSTGTMVYLQLEAFNVKEKKTDLSVAYIDHNMLQTDFMNADDHEYIKGVALKHGIIYSKAGGGICHQVHLERFAKPGSTLIGSDSHTPTAGGISALAIGAGGLDVAIAIARGYYYVTVPKVINIILKNKLNPFVSAKDVILVILKQLTVKGGVGSVLEYSGEGMKSLSVTDRATITNMGAELGATSSIFPTDEYTLDFLIRQNRTSDMGYFVADDDVTYDEVITIDLSLIEPSVALPHSPDNVDLVKNHQIKVNQVIVGSCTNSSYTDMMKVAHILKGKKIHPDVSFSVSPGSSNILRMLAENGALAVMISAGARILESGCGPCIGMGQAPFTNGVSLRTMNRNFKGRSGTTSADVYLVSPETAAVSALYGELTDPRKLTEELHVALPPSYLVNETYFIYPTEEDKTKEIKRGPNILPFPLGDRLEDTFRKTVLLKVGDNITTDDITPSSANLLPYRSNIPYLSTFCFGTITTEFKQRATAFDGGIIVAGENYGQGSSREHAALVPLYLKVKAVLAKSFARIHKANLINAGILPLTFVHADDHQSIDEFDILLFEDVLSSIEKNLEIRIWNETKQKMIYTVFTGSAKDRQVLLLGGTIHQVKGEM